MLPGTLLGLLITWGILRWMFRRVIPDDPITYDRNEHIPVNRRLLIISLVCLGGIVAGFCAGLNMSWTALGGAAALIVLAQINPRQIVKDVDWQLLFFFGCLFIVVGGLAKTNAVEMIYQKASPLFGTTSLAQTVNFTWFSVLCSNVFSNVPFVLVAGHWIGNFTEPKLMWMVLALSSTLGGNLTIVGSVANMVVLESARDHIRVGLWDYFRCGVLVTISTTVVGTAILAGLWWLIA